MIANTIEVEGTLEETGNLILDEKPAMQPGRVRVSLRPLASERLPHPPCVDEAIAAPFDLPRAGAVVRVYPRIVLVRLPELPNEIVEQAQ